MSAGKSLILIGLTGFLAACKMDGGIDAASIFSFEKALSQSYVTDFAPFEAAAAQLRNSDPKYTIQDFLWSFGSGPVYDSYFLNNANVEYAHAVGLTGAGQTIAVIDSGFLATHDEFIGKTITTPGGLAALGVDDHGTGVASIAAGSASNGNIVGVAPGADLQLGSFSSFSTMTAATRQARSIGAIVQNNSWGYNVDATQKNYNLIFGGSGGGTYLTALRNYAKNGVVVFSASNDRSRSRADLMAALPALVPSLEQSWIATISAVPNVSGNTINSATRVSSACLEAAAWCITADGTAYVATAVNASDYKLATGTSFATPQVSGAIALLAEAFPTLNGKELRARLLASANNSFFKHTGFVQFAPGIKHGFDDEFGHGFLDLRAALLPIGGAYVSTRSGRVPLNAPVVISGGMAGDALTTRLAKYDIMIVDGLGGGFSAPADVLAGQAIEQPDAELDLARLLAVDLNSPAADPFRPNPVFSEYVSGQEVSIDIDDNRLALLLPIDGGDDSSFGIALSRRFDLGGTDFSLGFTALHEADGFVGIKALAPGSSINADHAAATFEWALPVQKGQSINLSGSLGIAVPNGSVPAMSMQTVQYNSLNISYGARDIFGAGDRFSIGVGLPQVVHAGSFGVAIPVAMSATGVQYETLDVSLAPEARQFDLSVGYGLPVSDRSEILLSAKRSLNDGNIAGRSATVASIGFRFQF